MSGPLRRLRGILGHKLPDEFEPENWAAWLKAVRSSAEKHPPVPGVANVMELFREACSFHASVLEEAIYKWDTRRIQDLLEHVRLYGRARQFIEDHLDEIRADIDWTRVPKADNWKWEQLGNQGALTIDEAGMCLTGPEADQIVHIDSLVSSNAH